MDEESILNKYQSKPNLSILHVYEHTIKIFIILGSLLKTEYCELLTNYRSDKLTNIKFIESAKFINDQSTDVGTKKKQYTQIKIYSPPR